MIKKIFKIIVYIFAVIGFLFFSVFLGMQFNVFKVQGSIKERNSFFKEASKNTFFQKNKIEKKDESIAYYPWQDSLEWQVLREAFVKDMLVIDRASAVADVNARLIVASVVPEQIRFFTSNRESYKKYFEPLKILGTMSQFSLGVSGIKPETANKIELYLKDRNSPFYPGEKYENLLDYDLEEYHDSVLYKRLTDSHDHYYQYLYTAIFIKEIEMQWQNSGISITDRPDIIATIFNLGFSHSSPNLFPQVGGAPIEIAGEEMPFGVLASQFYSSSELTLEFPK